MKRVFPTHVGVNRKYTRLENAMNNYKGVEKLEREGKVIIEEKWDGVKIYALVGMFKNRDSARKYADNVIDNKNAYKIHKKSNSIFGWGLYGLVPDFLVAGIPKNINKILVDGYLVKIEEITEE